MQVSQRHGFREIAVKIRQEITEGHYSPGSVLPPEPELALRYGASRSLVNRAMQMLAAEGMVRPRQGRGTIVTWLPPMLHSPTQDKRPSENDAAGSLFDVVVRKLGLEPQREIVTERVQPPAAVAETLGLPANKVNSLVRRRRLLASGIPVRLDASWFPLSIVRGTALEEVNQEIAGGTKTALGELGYQQVTARERILPSRLPTDVEALALDISPERTVAEIAHVGLTAEGKAVEVTISVLPAHYLVAEYEIPT